MEELAKIMRATGNAADLELCVRLRVSSEHSELSLAAKFGAELGEVKELLMATRQAADALGICFHVGSQAMSPHAYTQAIERVRAAIVDASVTVDIIDVGGGFPSVYPGMEPPALELYFDAIYRAAESLPVSYSSELWCEPGRALAAEYSSLIVRVERRRGDELYINDGAYGALFDAAHIGWRFPVTLLRKETSVAELQPFRASMGRPATIWTIWPALPAAGRRAAGRLYRDRDARRLHGCADAHRLSTASPPNAGRGR